MLTAEKVRKARLAHHRDAKSVRLIAKEFHIPKNTNMARTGRNNRREWKLKNSKIITV